MSIGSSTLRKVNGWSFDAGEHIVGLSWLPDGKRLVVVPAEGRITVLDRITGGVLLGLPGHPAGNATLSVSSQRSRIVTGGHDGKVRIWNSETGELLRELDGGAKGSWVDHLLCSPDSSFLASAAGRCLRIWTLEGELQCESNQYESTIAALCWRPDSRGIAVGCYGGITLLREKQGEWKSYESLQWKGSIISASWSPNGRFVAGGSQERTIQFWRLPYRLGDELFMSGYQTKVKELAWDAGSRYLASGGGEVITVWDVSGRGPQGTRPMQLPGHEGKVTQLAFQNRGPLLASGGVDGSVLVWDLKNSKRHRRQLTPVESISKLSWSQDDTGLAIGAADGTVYVWDAKSGAV